MSYAFDSTGALNGEGRTPNLPKPKRVRAIQPKFHTEILICDSGWIRAIQYDTETNILDAHLVDGSRYRYRDISSWTFACVVTAKSSGATFNLLIKWRAFTKLPVVKKLRLVQLDGANVRSGIRSDTY